MITAEGGRIALLEAEGERQGGKGATQKGIPSNAGLLES